MLIFCGPLVTTVLAGSLDAPGGPDEDVSAMYSLGAICDRLETGAEGAKRGGLPAPFQEPTEAPGPTGCTLNDVMDKAPKVDDTNGAGAADVSNGKTFWGLTSGAWGLQTGELYGGCDCSGGALYRGRYCDSGDGTVTDLTSCLMWLKNANCFGTKRWVNSATGDDAQTSSGTLKSGSCSLSDGSVVGDWRLPTKEELYDLSNGTEPIRAGSPSPFSDVQSFYYWSSTTYESNPINAWLVLLSLGYVDYASKGTSYYVWPVRSGN